MNSLNTRFPFVNLYRVKYAHKCRIHFLHISKANIFYMLQSLLNHAEGGTKEGEVLISYSVP